jgi:hypothetical protein
MSNTYVFATTPHVYVGQPEPHNTQDAPSPLASSTLPPAYKSTGNPGNMTGMMAEEINQQQQQPPGSEVNLLLIPNNNLVALTHVCTLHIIP